MPSLMTAYLIVVRVCVFTVASKLNVPFHAVAIESTISATHSSLLDTYTGERAQNMSMVSMFICGKV